MFILLTTNLIPMLAQVAEDAAGEEKETAPWYVLVFGNYMFPIFAIMILFLIMSTRAKRAQERQKQAIMDQMKRGDRVQTIGGILGNVVEVRPEKVLVKVDESSNTKIWFSRNAIARVLEEEKAEAK